MADYKGIYYNDDNRQKFFEGGAHFKYIKLCKILEQLSAAQKIKLRREELNKKGASKKVAKTKEKKSQEQIKKIKNNITTVSNLYL
jgi:hypothetical protein